MATLTDRPEVAAEPMVPAPSLAKLCELIALTRNTVRLETDHLAEEEARAEQRCIDAAGEAGIGRNAEDRKRALTIALAVDIGYRFVRDTLRAAQRDLELLEARRDAILDGHRERRLTALERLTDADLAAVRFVEVG